MQDSFLMTVRVRRPGAGIQVYANLHCSELCDDNFWRQSPFYVIRFCMCIYQRTRKSVSRHGKIVYLVSTRQPLG